MTDAQSLPGDTGNILGDGTVALGILALDTVGRVSCCGPDHSLEVAKDGASLGFSRDDDVESGLVVVVDDIFVVDQ